MGRKSLEFCDQGAMGNYGEYTQRTELLIEMWIVRTMLTSSQPQIRILLDERPLLIHCAKELAYIVSMA